ncbi:MAG: phosphate ABC transporter permease subunit PstC [Desulfovibrionaceae bacterium]
MTIKERKPLIKTMGHSWLDVILEYCGLLSSIIYIFVILALIATLLIRSSSSIKQFSLSFLTSSQWNEKQTVLFPPVLSPSDKSISLRFSYPIDPDTVNNAISLSQPSYGIIPYTYSVTNRYIELFFETFHDGEYVLSIKDTLRNSQNYPIATTWNIAFVVEENTIVSTTISPSLENIDSYSRLYGAFPFIFGTLVSSLLAIAISFPFSIAIALYLNEYAAKTKRGYFLSSVSDLLAGIPSVIYGFWAMFFIVPYVGSNILTASLVLSIMTLPYSTSITREAIALVPKHMKLAGYALGGTKYTIIRTIIIPYAKSGIVAGLLLALGRALGETLAVTMVIGNSNRMSFSLFEPAQTIASLIANEYAEASGLKQSALIELALLLILITIFFGFLGRIIVKKQGKKS